MLPLQDFFATLHTIDTAIRLTLAIVAGIALPLLIGTALAMLEAWSQRRAAK